MHEDVTMEARMKEIPFNMSVKDVADFLEIGLSTAYKLVESDDFPKLKMPGSRLIRIPKHKFIEWYQQQCN